MDAWSSPTDLRTEYASTPVGIETDRPRFSWNPGGPQTAYRLRVAATLEDLETDPVWDSDRVASSDSIGVRYAGPPLDSGQRYHWTVGVWHDDATATWSDPTWWEMGLDRTDWKADWIRRTISDGDVGTARFQHLRSEFDLTGEVADARAYVAACHQCAIWLNGEEIGRGQSFCYPERQYYKTYDVTDALRANDANAIGCHLVWTGEGKGRPLGDPALLVQLVVEYEDGRREVVTTDRTWLTRDAPTQSGPERSPASREPIERIDARRERAGWTEPGFDDAGWDDPHVIGAHPVAPFETLIGQQREIARDERSPSEIRRLADGTLVADFGRVYAGVPKIAFQDGTAGRHVVVRTGFQLDEDGRVSTTEGVQWTDMHYDYIQRDGEQTFRPFIFLGFRYLELGAVNGAIDEDEEVQIRLLTRRNAVPDERASTFASSNDAVDDVRELARHSALYGSQEQFLDTPTREKGQFVSDSLAISTTTMAAFRERKLTQQALEEFCDSHERFWPDDGRVNAVYPTGEGRRDIPDYTLLFVEWVWQYYRETGDLRLLERAYPVLQAISEYVADDVSARTGLVTRLTGGDREAYRHGIVDWPEEMRYGYDVETAARTTVNVLAVAAFRRVADAAAALGRSGTDVAVHRRRAASLERSIDDHLTRPDGVYVDGLHEDGTRSDRASAHANAFPLAFDIVPDASVEAVADHLVGTGMEMGPMTAYWLLEALDAADRYEALVERITDPNEDGWANVLAQGGTFTWESWKARDLPDADRHVVSESHAWGATVLVAIQRFLLGVRIDAPGGSRIRISPPRGGLRRADGRVLAERGPIDVAWEREDPSAASPLELTVDLPASVTGTVVLPTADPGRAVVGIDGTERWNDGATSSPLPDGVVRIEPRERAVAVTIAGGSHRFTCRETGPE